MDISKAGYLFKERRHTIHNIINLILIYLLYMEVKIEIILEILAEKQK